MVNKEYAKPDLDRIVELKIATNPFYNDGSFPADGRHCTCNDNNQIYFITQTGEFVEVTHNDKMDGYFQKRILMKSCEAFCFNPSRNIFTAVTIRGGLIRKEVNGLSPLISKLLRSGRTYTAVAQSGKYVLIAASERAKKDESRSELLLFSTSLCMVDVLKLNSVPIKFNSGSLASSRNAA